MGIKGEDNPGFGAVLPECEDITAPHVKPGIILDNKNVLSGGGHLSAHGKQHDETAGFRHVVTPVD